MKVLFVSYHHVPGFNDPDAWLKRIGAFVEILDELSAFHEVYCIHRINYSGSVENRGTRHIFLSKQTSVNKYVKQLKPDVVIVQGLLTPLQLIFLRMQLGKKVRIIAQHHAEKPFGRIKGFISRIADRLTDAYFFATLTMAKS